MSIKKLNRLLRAEVDPQYHGHAREAYVAFANGKLNCDAVAVHTRTGACLNFFFQAKHAFSDDQYTVKPGARVKIFTIRSTLDI